MVDILNYINRIIKKYMIISINEEIAFNLTHIIIFKNLTNIEIENNFMYLIKSMYKNKQKTQSKTKKKYS